MFSLLCESVRHRIETEYLAFLGDFARTATTTLGWRLRLSRALGNVVFLPLGFVYLGWRQRSFFGKQLEGVVGVIDIICAELGRVWLNNLVLQGDWFYTTFDRLK